MKKTYILILLAFSFLSLNAQNTVLSNPLENFVGEWQLQLLRNSEIRSYWKVTKMEVGYGIQITANGTEGYSLTSSFTLIWACNPKNGKAYSLVTFPDGIVGTREGSIESNGNLIIKWNNDNENYTAHTYTFESKDKVQVKRVTYEDGKEVTANRLEWEMIRIK